MFLKYIYRPHYQWDHIRSEFHYCFVPSLHCRRTEYDEWQPVETEAYPNIEEQCALLDRFPPPEPPTNSRPAPL